MFNSIFTFNSKFGTKYQVKLVRGQYGNGAKALQFLDAEDGSPVLVATVNTGHIYEPEQIAIKDYSENEGVAEFLEEIGFIDGVDFIEEMGFVDVLICHLSKDAQAFFGIKN